MNRVIRALFRRILGARGEDVAADYLRRSGMKILVRRYRTRLGEIDLIARERQVVVFVEVKARRRGTPSEAVTPEKQRRLTLTALQFLKLHGLLDQPSRFDVVSVLWPDDRQPPTIEHIRYAFEAVGRGQFFR